MRVSRGSRRRARRSGPPRRRSPRRDRAGGARRSRAARRGEDLGALWLIEAEARRSGASENEPLRGTAATRAMQALAPGTAGWCDAASELAAVFGLARRHRAPRRARARASATRRRPRPAAAELARPAAYSQLVNALARLARPLFWAGKCALASLVLSRAAVLADRADHRAADGDGRPTTMAARRRGAPPRRSERVRALQ